MEAWKSYSVAIEEYENEDFKAAFEKFEKLAKQGHLEAMSMLATMYGAGQFVPKNIAKSIEWDMKAIEQGSHTSIANLATTYLQIGKNELAEKWFLKSISIGDGDSMLDLAKMKLKTRDSTVEIKQLLIDAIASSSITQHSKNEAESILQKLEID